MSEASWTDQLQIIVGGIIETVPDAVTVTNEHGFITFANTAAERILALSRKDVIGRCFDDIRWHITGINGEPCGKRSIPSVKL